MRNHYEKAKDMAESVLPSTARASAAQDRRRIHQRERAGARGAVARYLADPEGGDEQAESHIVERRFREDIANLVSDRRGRDKVGSLCRWAVRRAATRPELAALDVADQVTAFRQIFADNLIGRHAVSHLEWALQWEQMGRNPLDRRQSYREPAKARIESQLRIVLEAGGHGQLNRELKVVQAGWEQPPRVLHGTHDIEAFADFSLGRPAIEKVLAAAATRYSLAASMAERS